MLNATWLVVILLSGSVAVAHQMTPCERALNAAPEIFAPRQLSRAALSEKGSWELLWHKTERGEVQLIAFQRASLLVRRLNPWTGGIVSEKRWLNDGAKTPTESMMHSVAGGELILASLRKAERTIELASDRSEFKIHLALEHDIRQIEVLSLNREVFVAVAGINSVSLFKRSGTQLEKVASIQSQPLMRRLYAFVSGEAQISLAFLSSDHKMRLFQWDNEINELKEGPGFVQLGGKAEPQALNGQVFFLASENTPGGNTSLRLFASGSKVFTRSVELKTVIGKAVMRDDGNGNAQLVIPIRNGGRSDLVTLDAARNQVVESTGIGDARTISDLSQTRLGGKEFFLFTKDSQIVYIQNGNETSILPAPARSFVRQLTPAMKLNNGQTAVAILGEGPAGSSVSVIGLTQ